MKIIASDKICKFCNKPVPHMPLAFLESRGIKVFFCKECHAEYIFMSKGLIYLHLYTSINEKVYRWSVSFKENNEDSAYIWFIGKPGVPAQKANREVKMLKKFPANSYHEINPQNINEKIQTMLIFL